MDGAHTEQPSPLIVRMLATNGWDGEAAGAWVLLSGGSVDRFPPLMTMLIQAPGAASVSAETELPILLPERRHGLAAEICCAVNRHLTGGALSITTIGRPAVTSKRMISEAEDIAVRQFTELVLWNRAVARSLFGVFIRVAEGVDAADILAEASCPPLSISPRAAAVLPLDDSPGEEHRRLAAAALRGSPGVTELEIDGLARLDALGTRKDAASYQLCAGPLVLHADGVAECYGCERPLEHNHLSGASGQCRPGRAFGIGHTCSRCGAGLA